MEGPPLGPGGGDITWPDQVAPRGRKASSTRKIKPQTSNLFQELMNKILYILRRRPLVQELISRGAEMEAHIDDVSLGTNTKEDHVLLLREFFIVCQENHLRIKLEKCEFMKEEMEYLGFDVGYGWWKPAASKMQPLHDMQIRDDPCNGTQHVRADRDHLVNALACICKAQCKLRKRRTASKNKAKNRFFRPQKPQKKFLRRCLARSQNLGHSQNKDEQ